MAAGKQAENIQAFLDRAFGVLQKSFFALALHLSGDKQIAEKLLEGNKKRQGATLQTAEKLLGGNKSVTARLYRPRKNSTEETKSVNRPPT